MKTRIDFIIKELEKHSSFYRKQQMESRDSKRQFFWLGKSNAIAESISLIKRTFYKELNEQSTLPLTEVKK
jgi:hypothetical protein